MDGDDYAIEDSKKRKMDGLFEVSKRTSTCSSARFDKLIKRNKICNFASQCMTKVLSTKDKNNKVLLKMAISLNIKNNLEYCLSFPLAPLPPALSSCSGEMLKTPKSTLAKILKSKTEIVEPTHINVEIINGFYYLHLIGSSIAQTFDKIAESILIKICSTNATDIHLISDRYLSPSIKDSERESRKELDIPYKISGPQQTRPKTVLQSLKNYCFQEALVPFLADYWGNDHLVTIIQNKKIFITVGHRCNSYQVQENSVKKLKKLIMNVITKRQIQGLFFMLLKRNQAQEF